MPAKENNLMMRIFITVLALLVSVTAQALPTIESWTTGNGSRVLFVEAKELPMLDLRVVFDAGAARDADRPGVAKLTNALLDQGAAGLGADEIASGFERHGAELGGGSERDMAWLSLRSLSDRKQLEPSFELFTKVMSKADFPAKDFKRERQLTLTGLEYQKQKPKSILEKSFYSNLFGAHPYASNPSGTEESVAALRIKHLKAFYQRYYVAKNATIVMVGAIDRAQAERMAETLSDALPAGSKAGPLPEVAALADSKSLVIEHPSSQSHVQMGSPGVYRGDPDYFALYIGNHVLGGSGLVSRISEEIREKRGLSYSAYSYFLPMRRQGPYMLGFQTKNQQREEALQVLRDTVRTFIEKGPTKKELASSKNNIIGGFPLRVSSNGKIIEYLAMIGFYDLPLDYLSTFPDKINAVTVDQVKDAYRRRVDIDTMVTVIVGGA